MVNLSKIYNSYMYNYYDYSIHIKKPSNLEELTKKFFKVERDWVTWSRKLGTTLKSRLHQKFLSHKVVTRSRMKTENLAFLESVTRQFSSLPIFVDCNKVRKHFEYILYTCMEAFQLCKCKSTADRTCDFTPLSVRRSFEHNFAINVK